MPLPKGLARFNRIATNRVTGPFASRLPWFGVLHHVGRKTSREYRTPVNAWRRGSNVVVPLTYGSDVDWLRNTEAAESSMIVMRGRSIRIGKPTVQEGPEVTDLMPGVFSSGLKLLDVTEFASFPIL